MKALHASSKLTITANLLTRDVTSVVEIDFYQSEVLKLNFFHGLVFELFETQQVLTLLVGKSKQQGWLKQGLVFNKRQIHEPDSQLWSLPSALPFSHPLLSDSCSLFV